MPKIQQNLKKEFDRNLYPKFKNNCVQFSKLFHCIGNIFGDDLASTGAGSL